jgi:hypothetical protein
LPVKLLPLRLMKIRAACPITTDSSDAGRAIGKQQQASNPPAPSSMLASASSDRRLVDHG